MIPFVPRRRRPSPDVLTATSSKPGTAAQCGGLCRAPDVAAVAAALDRRADTPRAGPWEAAFRARPESREGRLAAVAALRARTEAERQPAPRTAATLPFARFACRARDLEPATPVHRPNAPVEAAIETALAPSPRPDVPGFGRWVAPWQGG